MSATMITTKWTFKKEELKEMVSNGIIKLIRGDIFDTINDDIKVIPSFDGRVFLKGVVVDGDSILITLALSGELTLNELIALKPMVKDDINSVIDYYNE